MANAGVSALDDDEPDPRQSFRDVIDINLVGVWNTLRAGIEPVLAGERGGSIVIIQLDRRTARQHPRFRRG